jgi:hypothetical protein
LPYTDAFHSKNATGLLLLEVLFLAQK